MDNLQIQDPAKEYEIPHLSTADQLLVLSHLPGEWSDHTTFHRRLSSLLHLHKHSHTYAPASTISQLITDFEISEKPNADFNTGKLSPFPAIKKLVDLVLAFDASIPASSLGSFLQHINILTFHHSKGLEFFVVFVVGVQLGIFPNDFFIQSQDDLETERSLFLRSHYPSEGGALFSIL
jgi:DNA helicase-2/ATP-dependent DNA helicase PcrA